MNDSLNFTVSAGDERLKAGVLISNTEWGIQLLTACKQVRKQSKKKRLEMVN